MKGVIIDFEKLTDSKELYEQRPNRALSGFIYAVTMLVVAAVLFSFFGKIEIVSTGSGVIRPNDKVSTVSGMVSGQIANVSYTDGATVNEGDILLVLDYTDLQTDLTQLQTTMDTTARERELWQKYLDSIHSQTNLFSSSPDSDEFPFYVKYSYYDTSLKDKALTASFEEERDKLSMVWLENQLMRQRGELNGLQLLRDSVKTGDNLVEGNSRYNYQFLLYEMTLESIERDFNKDRRAILEDASRDTRQLSIDFYTQQLEGYKKLLQSIEEGRNLFSDDSMYSKMYEDYAYTREDSEWARESAEIKLDALEDTGKTDSNADTVLEYHNTMLEGYKLYKESVSGDRDAFDQSKVSYHYRSLYLEYLEKDRQAKQALTEAKSAYDTLAADQQAGGEATAAQVEAARSDMESCQRTVDNLKSQTLAEIDNMVLQIQSNIAEVKMGQTSGQEYELDVAEKEIDNADRAIEAGRNKTKQEIENNIQEIELKLKELEIEQDFTQDKEVLVDELLAVYTQTSKDKYWSTLQEVEDSIKTLEDSMASNESELRQLQNTWQYYENNVNAESEKIPVAYTRLGELQTCLDTVTTLDEKLRELDYNIKKTELDIEAATIRAVRSGVINSTQDIAQGDVLEAGIPLATIIPPEESQFKVQIYMDNKDIAGIKPGDPVKYNIAALPSSQYGSLQGTVLSVSKDTKSRDEQTQAGYYLVEATLDNQVMRDKNGNEADITVGMSLNAKVVTQKKRIISYLMEKINLF